MLLPAWVIPRYSSVKTMPILASGSWKARDDEVAGLPNPIRHEEANMALFPRLFGQPGAGGNGGRKVRVSDRLDRFVSTAARRVDEPEESSYVIDKNYEIVYTGPAPRK
jgi:hypothetical protein